MILLPPATPSSRHGFAVRVSLAFFAAWLLLVGLPPRPARAENVPPTASITPLSSSTVGGVIQVSMTATDNVAVASVSLLVDGVSVGTDTTAPYTVNWNTNTVANGAHTLIARAIDTSNNPGNSSSVPVTVQNPAFVNETVVPGITGGITVAFLPDGRMLIGDYFEKVWVVPPGGSAPKARPMLDLAPVGLQGEQGLMEVIVDPNFATNGYYYVFYTHAQVDGARNRVSRFTASGDTTLPNSEFVLWQDNVAANLEHHGGGMAILPGNKLFISVGEAFFPDDAQRLDSYRGKLLRINLDGTIPSDNPFVDGPGGNMDEIWALGLRNPTRMSYDAPTGRLFISNVGGNDNNTSIEEINVAARGANYGWPICEGPCGNPAYTDPIYWYSHNMRDACVMAGFVYRGGNFPADYQGTFFFGDYSQNWIRRLTFDGSGNVIGPVNFEPADGSADGPTGDIVKILQGPDGALYYVDLGFDAEHNVNGAAVRRIRYLSSGNQPPVAAATGSPLSGPAPLSVTFSSAGSFDPEGQPLTYDWQFGDGASSTAANPSHTYSASGSYTVQMRVNDGTSWTLANAFVVSVGTPPTANILTPANGALFRAGDVITYSGSATDGSGNSLPASAYSWTIVFHHETHIHPSGGPFTGITSGTFTIPVTGHDFSGNTSYEFILTVTWNGLQATKSVFIYPDKVNVTFNTNPVGLSIDLGGIRTATPFTLGALKGFQYTINAPTQSYGAYTYGFSSWSDGGAVSHTITVPNQDSSWTASYTAVGPSSLVASYNFDEGSGPTATDRSGNNNTATLVNATWTAQGKYGSAVQLNGANALVRILDAASLDLTTGMTLEAWVYLGATAGGWADIMMKEGDAYYLAAENGRPAVGASVTTPLYAPATLPLATWTHVACTYDGATLKIYVNGAVVNSRSLTGPLTATNGPLTIGGDALYGQYLTGKVDDVRVYNVARTATEIQGDMNQSVTAIDDEPSPPRAMLGVSAAPNPFTPQTEIRFRLAQPGTPRLRIFEVSGRLVRTLALPALPAGEHHVTWNGTSDRGVRLGSGVYIARLETPDGVRAMRIVLVR